MWPFTQSAREQELQRLLAAERSSHDATKRELRVIEAERDALAAVVARDRARVAAETAEFCRRQADAEGAPADANGTR
jgi:hypothetical protein